MINIKNKKKDRNKVNFKNQRVKYLINILQLSENKLTKQDIYELGNKDIFYQLKNSNYIKETSKGVFQGTKTLRNKIEKQTGQQFGKGSSIQHSQKILEVVKCIPESIVQTRNFQTGTEIDQKYQKWKTTETYKEKTEKLQKSYEEKLEKVSKHQGLLKGVDATGRDSLRENLSNQVTKHALERTISIIKENAYSVPDFSFKCSKEESTNFFETLNENGLQPSFRYSNRFSSQEETAQKIQQIMEESSSDIITWTVEIITNNYGSYDLERHYLFDKVTSTNTIYI